MIRTRTSSLREPDALFCGDIHLRDDKPVCRTDDFEKAQWDKLDFISSLQVKYNCPVLHSGDLFHAWKSSPYLLSKIIEHIPKQFFSVLGNHDLPQHNLEQIGKSGINVLAKAGVLTIIKGCHFGQEPTDEHIINIKQRKLLLWHIMTYQTKEPYPGCTAPKAIKLLQENSDIDCILTGDNHNPFVEQYEGRILVNPGCMTRQTAAFADFLPRIYLYYADTNTVEAVYLPIEQGVVSREHIIKKEEHDGRIDAFVSHLQGEWKVGISFEDNLKEFASVNNVEKPIMDIINNFMQ